MNDVATYYVDPSDGDDRASGATSSDGWKTFAPLSSMTLQAGDRVEVISAGDLTRTLVITGSGTKAAPISLRFAPGRYDLYPDATQTQQYHISNTNGDPDGHKAIGLMFDRASNVDVSGSGARLVSRGKMIQVCIDHCTNVSIRGLQFDYARPTVSEFRVDGVAEEFADLHVHPDSWYELPDGRITWMGEGWQYQTGLAQELDPDTDRIWRRRDPLDGLRIEELEPCRLRAHGQHDMTSGRVYQIRETWRDYAAVFIQRSTNISWIDVQFLFLHGMGIVAQFTRDLLLSGVSVAPDPSRGRTCAAWADCFQASGCSGRIVVTDSHFCGAHDDAINVHGTYLRVVEKVDARALRVRFMHHQTYGFAAFQSGDKLSFVRWDSLASFGSGVVSEVVLESPTDMLLTLHDPPPESLRINDAVENITWTPQVQIDGCTVRRIPTRGFLVATPRRVLIENNEFRETHMAALLFGIDANDWFESGAVSDVTIRGNTFHRCAEPVIEIAPGNSVPNDSVHQNIRITNNEFELMNRLAVGAASARNLRVERNTIHSARPLDDHATVQTDSCAEVVVEQNSYKVIPASVSPAERLSELRTRLESTRTAVDASSGYAKKAGLIDLRIAAFFADYVEWELANPELTKDALLANEMYSDNLRGPAERTAYAAEEGERERRYSFHIDYELAGALQLVEEASERLEIGVNRSFPEDIRWEDQEYHGGYFRVGGRPVFSGGFTMIEWSFVDVQAHPEWADRDAALTTTFLRDMRELGVGVIGISLPVAGLVTADGTVSSDGIRQIVSRIERLGELGFKVDVLLNWNGDNDALEREWPGLTEYYGNGVNLDVDHPGTRILVTRVMSELMPALRELAAIMSWDLANEPFFGIAMWSPHTLSRYRDWLADRHGTIGALNERWHTAYSRFDHIPLPGDSGRAGCSAGEWHDRVTFHNSRVASFFEFVSQEIRRFLPGAVIHLKAQDNSSLGPRPEAVVEGIDRELLTPMATLQGVDTRPLPVTEPRMAARVSESAPVGVLGYDDAHYGLHWLGQSFLYDYLTSIDPDKPMVDFEYHAFSINAIRIPDIRRSHSRVALWMAHLHGLISNSAWYWHRRYGPFPFPEPSDYFQMWLYGSISTQPLLAAEYFHTLLDLNTHAREVEALATVASRPVRLLVSQSSYVQNQAHINALHRAYEGSCFHGLRVGFVTERMLANDGVPSDCRTIILPDAEFLTRSALAVLRQCADRGIHLIRIGDRSPVYDEYGAPLPNELLAFLARVPAIAYADAPTVSARIGEHIADLAGSLPVQVTRLGSNQSFGIMHRQTVLDGYLTVLLINVSHTEQTVCLWHLGTDAYDVLNGEEIDPLKVRMPLHGVRLIRARQSAASKEGQ